MINIYTFPQCSDAWFKAKLGIMSTSHFSDILAKGKGKTRRSYMTRLCGEILTGVHRETYSNADMRRGIEQEPEARREYEFVTGRSVDTIGFAVNGRYGCSPDGLVGSYGGMEIKCVIPSTQTETLLRNGMPPAHKAQVQGCMLIMECGFWDFVSYSPLMERKLFIERIYRDGVYIVKLQEALALFYGELTEMVEQIKKGNTTKWK